MLGGYVCLSTVRLMALKSRGRGAVVPFHFQLAANDCAPACVMAIAEWYGISISLGEVRRRLVTDPVQGTTIKQFQLGLSDLFQVRLGRQKPGQLDPGGLPFIAFWPQQEHFVVVWAVDPSGVMIGDPGNGLQRMPLSTFLQYWDGITIVLIPRRGGGDVRCSRPAVRPLVRRMVGRDWGGLILLAGPATLLGVTNAAFSIFMPFYLSDLPRLEAITAGFLGVSLVLSAFTAWWAASLRRRLNHRGGLLLESAFPRLNTHFFTVGDAYTRFQDVQSVVDVILGLARDFPYTLTVALGTLGYLLYRQPALAVFFSGLMMVILSGLAPFVGRMRDYLYQVRLKSARLNNALRQAWGKAPEPVFASWNGLVDVTFRQTLWSIPIGVAVSQTPALGILAVLLLIGLRHGISPGTAPLLSTLFLVNYLTSAIHSLYQKYVAWQVAQPSLYRLHDFWEDAK